MPTRRSSMLIRTNSGTVTPFFRCTHHRRTDACGTGFHAPGGSKQLSKPDESGREAASVVAKRGTKPCLPQASNGNACPRGEAGTWCVPLWGIAAAYLLGFFSALLTACGRAAAASPKRTMADLYARLPGQRLRKEQQPVLVPSHRLIYCSGLGFRGRQNRPRWPHSCEPAERAPRAPDRGLPVRPAAPRTTRVPVNPMKSSGTNVGFTSAPLTTATGTASTAGRCQG